jgi:hypothetical protein
VVGEPLPVLRRGAQNQKPHDSRTSDAAKMPIFAVSNNSAPNAKLAMKSDIVKPIPHNSEAPKM